MRTLICVALAMVMTACAERSDPNGWPKVGFGSEAPRAVVNLDEGWMFHKGAMDPAPVTQVVGGKWERVSLPHTWNALDGQDGGTPYFRGDGWYRRVVDVPEGMAGKELYLRFEGANRRSEVFVNGEKVGGHVGGTQAFVMDVTGAVKAGANQVTVHVDNKKDLDSPPLQADFTFFGGIYRGVELLAVDPVHVSLTDHGSLGVYVTTPEVSAETAKVHVRSLVRNDSKEVASGILLVRVLGGVGKVVESRQGFILDAGQEHEVPTDVVIAQPHLWNGRKDPYLYRVEVSVLSAGGAVVDDVSQPLGIRTFSVDPEKGFILNGKPYGLHGVDVHQERQDKGWAISAADEAEDIALIAEMGCTAVRAAHYEHSQNFYDLCDRAGLVVWAEVPVVDRLGSSQAFTDNARQQYVELIRQEFNHPCICFWSAGNEVDASGNNFNKAGPAVYAWFREMSALGHAEDPSRLTAAAYREKFFPPADVTDVFGLNIYLGWYDNSFDDLPKYIVQHDADGAKGKWGVTEYGAGASIHFHSEKPVRMDHTEEYQAIYHEKNWGVLKEHPEIWGKFVWAMFDFASDGRFEGDHAGINDKGLVTHDRQVKKDAFYFYKANWSDEPTVHIASKRFAVRGVEAIPVKVYSNAPRVELTVNGEMIGEKGGENATFLWEGVKLRVGENRVVATGMYGDGKRVEDETVFTYTPGAPTAVYEGQDAAMKKALLGGPPRVGFPKAPAATRPAGSAK